MALTNAGYSALPSGNQLGGVPAKGPGGDLDPFAVGIVTLTGDGSATTSTVNWIDGTQTLPFTPSAVLVQIVGGTDTAGVLKATAPGAVTSISATSFVLNFSTAPGNAATVKVLCVAYK